MSFLLLILIFTRPFISSLAFPYFNHVHSVLLIGALCIWAVRNRDEIQKSLGRLILQVSLFMAALLISFFFSDNKLAGAQEAYKYAAALLLLFFAASLPEVLKKRVISCILLSGLLISILAIYQYFFGFRHLLDYINSQGIKDLFVIDSIGRKRVFFPFVTANALAGYLAMLIPIALFHRKLRWCALPLSFALLLTKSIGGLLSLLAGLIVYFALRGKIRKREIIAIGLSAGLAVMVFYIRSVTGQEHVRPGFSTIMRLGYWIDSFSLIAAHPLAGMGLGNFDLIESRYAHNSFLQIWAETGIFGIASFLWLIVSLLGRGIKNLKTSPDAALSAGLISANLVFLAHNLIDFTFFLPEVSFTWWIISGLLVAASASTLQR